MLIADLHIHSKYSLATSRDCDAQNLDLWDRRKGIGLIGTGDFTHPAWRQELADALEPAEDGLYRLKANRRLPCRLGGEASVSAQGPQFVVSGEISTIYKKNGRTRKVHHVILLPSLEAGETLAHKLEAIGNLHSDGRPILGLDSRDLLEIVLSACPQAVYIPAHIWTPHFSVFGAFSGFETLEECFEDLTPHVHALETGLSSDPPMNRRVSMLDPYTMVSNSDAHSPAKLGREANLLRIAPSYAAMKKAIETGEGFEGTLEFFPEEGKYHLDGHRGCDVRLEPEETKRLSGLCPVCGRKLTIGVQHRVEELADRESGFPFLAGKRFESLIPLPEVIGASIGVAATGKKVQERYFAMLARLGPEFSILRDIPIDEIETAAGYATAEGIRRLRAGKVQLLGGFDGEYGTVSLFAPGELEKMGGQLAMPGLPEAAPRKKKVILLGDGAAAENPAKDEGPLAGQDVAASLGGLNEQQREAAETRAPEVAVIAGPGTGKTKTLVERVACLVEQLSAHPSEITAVTFTNQAAREMRERLEARLGKKQCRGLTIGTFHAICLGLLPPKPLLGESEALSLIKQILAEQGERLAPLACLRMISAVKNGLPLAQAGLDKAVFDAYAARLEDLGVRDLDDLLLCALDLPTEGLPMFTHVLVDEFQDVSPVQRQLIRHWAEGGKSLFVIGDPDQSIYGFRGADAACFAELEAQVPGLSTITLRQNYRSTPQVLQSAVQLIDHNPGPARLLTAHKKDGPPVRLACAQSAFDEAVWIAKEIAGMVGGVDMLGAAASGKGRHGTRSFSDIAVLCRTRHRLAQLETALRHDSIPCVIYGRDDFLSDGAVAGALGFCRWLPWPSDGASLESCLKAVWRIPGPLAQRAVAACAAMAQPDINALRREFSSFQVLGPWLAATEAYLPQVGTEKPRRLLETWAAQQGKTLPMERLMHTSVFFEDMPSMLSTLLTGEDADVRRASTDRYLTDAVRLMTVHGSKGLEFPVVFLLGDGFPAKGDDPLPEKMAEERRLFFVGMTRARDELILTSGDESACFLAEVEATREVVRIRKQRQRTEQLSLF